MIPLEEFGRRIAQEQDAVLARSRVREVLRPTIASLRVGPQQSRRRIVRWALAAIVPVLLVSVWVLHSNRPLEFSVGKDGAAGTVGAWLSAPRHAALPVRFSDGTMVTLMAASRGRVAKTSRHGAELVLESGEATFAGTPHPGAHWELRTGPFVVSVTGTRFHVGWDSSADVLVLRVQEGSVKVSGCVFGGRGRPVMAGEVLRASCEKESFAIAKSAELLEAAGQESEPEVSESTETSPQPLPNDAGSQGSGSPPVPSIAQTRPPAATWEELAANGQFADALQTARQSGYTRLCGSLGPDQLTKLGDVARYAGRIDLARQAYTSVRRRFPGTHRAAIAAFALGRMAQDKSGAYAEAARWYRVCLAEQPTGGLTREALGRLMEALHHSGDRDGARRVAAQYVKKHADGPHAVLADQLLQSRVGRGSD
jgi:hypothetical protein